MGQPGAVREVVPQKGGQQVQDAHARGAWRARLPRSGESGPRAVHYPPAPRRSVEAALLPRRRALGAQAPELKALVPDCGGLARPVAEVTWKGQRSEGRGQ